VYEIDTVAPIYRELATMTSAERELRVLTDHVRAVCFMIGDGVAPSNKDRGYIVRRLLRRCFLLARQLGLPHDWHHRSVARVVETFASTYELDGDESLRVIDDERTRFERSVAHGEKLVRGLDRLDGKRAFDLFQTHGIPFELTLELAQQAGATIDREDFQRELERHRELSRTTGSFAGGLADHSTEIVRYHTLTHLLHAALREVLGTHVIQRGSNITRERLRFDFSHDHKLTSDELARVEAVVNGWLARDLVVERVTLPIDEARALGAIGAFGEKYGETVSVYTISDGDAVISREFCGGPHVQSSRELTGTFRITREQAVAAGIRRIKAVLE
jgi:alanyl-tRNA synthetase